MAQAEIVPEEATGQQDQADHSAGMRFYRMLPSH